jgi:hypothetical protein
MSNKEVALMDTMEKEGRTAQEALTKLRAARAKTGAAGPSQTRVYRFFKGETYQRGAKENRCSSQ